MKREVTCIGGGLAGCELALQLAARGVTVTLVEMRPEASTPAHKTDLLAELVCSNSLKSEDPGVASGLFKRELDMLGCRLISIARRARVPAGHALAVDREQFARLVTGQIEREPYITLERCEQVDLDLPPCSIIAAGPLASQRLSDAIRKHFSSDHLYFYDAISISVDMRSIDTERMYRASRYGKGGDDYWNVPLSKGEYGRVVDFLRDAPRTAKRGFEQTRCFESCLPVEVIASRGTESLRFGPLKPKGLVDSRTGREPYAVLQLRQETSDGTMLGLVGFQTRITRSAQRELMKLVPGLEQARIVRWGSIHRNTFLDSPRLLDPAQMSRNRAGLFFSGQLVGVEGYVESIAHGLVTAENVHRYLSARTPVTFPRETLIGSLQRYVSGAGIPFQPMNVNFGLLPPLKGNRNERKGLMAERSLESLREFVERHL